MLTPGAGVLVDVHAAGVSFPELLQTRGQYQMKPPLPFVPGSEVAGVVRSAPRRRAGQAGRSRRRLLRARRLRRDGRRARVLHLPAARRARLRAGREPDPQLPHRLLLPRQLRGRLQGGRDGARARRRRRRRHGRRCRSPRRSARARSRSSRPRRRSASPSEAGADEVVLLGDALEGRGQGALRRRRRRGARPGRRRSLHRQPALAARGRAARRRRLHRRLDPRGQGQPPAAQQHRGDRRRLGRLRDGQARAQPRDRRGDRAR